MVGGVDVVLTVVGVTVLAGFAASAAFRRWRVPDVLLLILLGVAFGPFAGLLSPESVRNALPAVATLALTVVLLDCGVGLDARTLRSAGLRASLLALVVFVLTAALCALALVHLAAFAWPNALLLGMALGGAGVVIVVPLVRHLNAGERANAIVGVEAAVSDAFVVVAVYAFAAAAALDRLQPGRLAATLALTFGVALGVGAAAGWAWSRILPRILDGRRYALTLAFVLLTHAAVETLGGSGPVGALAFGLALGSATPRRAALDALHDETLFVVRTVFFVMLGASLDLAVFQDGRLVAIGVVLACSVALGRWFGVNLVYPRGALSERERLAVVLMFPLGLAAAALSLVPHERFGLGGTEAFASLAAAAIVLTNLFSAGFVWLFGLPVFARRWERPAAEA